MSKKDRKLSGGLAGKTSVGDLYLERLERLRLSTGGTGGPTISGHSIPAVVRKEVLETVEDELEVSKSQKVLIWEEAKANKEYYEQKALEDECRKPWFRYVKKKTQYGEFILLTPDMSEELLRYNPDNRHISPQLASSYRRDVENDNWIPTHEGIGINLSGNMFDGQHRATGIEEAGIAVPIWVVFNVLDEAKFVADSGKKRSVNEKLNLVCDAQLGNRTAGTVKAMMRGTSPRIKYSESEIAAFAVKYQHVINWLAEHIPAIRADAQAAIGKAYLWYGPAKIEDFCRRFKQLHFSNDGDPAKALYIFLSRAKTNRANNPLATYKKALSAIEHLIAGTTCARLYERDEDIFQWIINEKGEYEVPSDAPVNKKS